MSENFQRSVDKDMVTHEEDAIDVLGFLIVIAKHKKVIIRNTIVVALFTILVSFFLPKIYTATTTIMAPEQGQSTSAAMLGQLGALAGVAGASLGIKNPSDLYIGMLKSRTIQDEIIKRFGLLKVYDLKVMTDARNVLDKNAQFYSGKDGMVTITFDDRNPNRAADVANAYVEELNKLTSTLAITEASQRRLFFEKQLNLVKDKLAKSEYDLQKLQEKAGLIQDYPAEKEIAESNAKLRAEIAAKEVRLSAMQIGVTAKNPEYIRVEGELASLKSRLKGVGAQGLIPSQASTNSLEYLEKFRDVKFNQALLEMLYKQFELAKIDEAKDYPLIQVVDRALPPEKKSKPRQMVIVVASTLLSMTISLIWALFIEFREKAIMDPLYSEKFELLRKYGFGK